jgi:hypothetical protein
MTIGYPIVKATLDNTMGGLVVALRDSLNAIVSFKVLLDDTTILPDATLTALGYTGSTASGEIKIIRDSFTDLKKLSDISRAAATQSPASDFWFNAKLLAGVNLH